MPEPADAVHLPQWPAGTVALLSVVGSGGAPGCIPVSTALRASDTRVLLALGRRRSTLAALRADGRCALALLGAANVAVTLHGRAHVIADAPPGAENIAAVAVDVDRLQDHTSERFVIADGVQWSWQDEAAQGRDQAVRRVLQQLAAAG